MMQIRGVPAVALLLLSSACARHADSRTNGFLTASLQPQKVALTLATVEDTWRGQVEIASECSGETAGDATHCASARQAFVQSCSTVVSAVVSASSGDRASVKEYMGNVCGQRVLKAWRKERCGMFAVAIDGGMSDNDYENRVNFDSTKICSAFFERFTVAEKALHEAEEKRMAVERAEAEKKAAEEAAKEKKRQEEQEALRKAEDAKRAEEEKKRKAEETKQKAEEAERLAERQAEEAKKQAEEAKKKAAAELAANAEKVTEEAEKKRREADEAKIQSEATVKAVQHKDEKVSKKEEAKAAPVPVLANKIVKEEAKVPQAEGAKAKNAPAAAIAKKA